jgi:hypothetical protein
MIIIGVTNHISSIVISGCLIGCLLVLFCYCNASGLLCHWYEREELVNGPIMIELTTI